MCIILDKSRVLRRCSGGATPWRWRGDDRSPLQGSARLPHDVTNLVLAGCFRGLQGEWAASIGVLVASVSSLGCPGFNDREIVALVVGACPGDLEGLSGRYFVRRLEGCAHLENGDGLPGERRVVASGQVANLVLAGRIGSYSPGESGACTERGLPRFVYS